MLTFKNGYFSFQPLWFFLAILGTVMYMHIYLLPLCHLNLYGSFKIIMIIVPDIQLPVCVNLVLGTCSHCLFYGTMAWLCLDHVEFYHIGDNVIACMRHGEIARHNNICDTIFEVARSANLAPREGEATLIPSKQLKACRHPDSKYCGKATSFRCNYYPSPHSCQTDFLCIKPGADSHHCIQQFGILFTSLNF